MDSYDYETINYKDFSASTLEDLIDEVMYSKDEIII